MTLTAGPVSRSGRRGFSPLTVAAVEELTEDSVAVTFEIPEPLAASFAFRAGQSLTLRRRVEGVEHRRSYSICAPVGARPRIGVRLVPGGALSTWLVREVRPGDVVEVQPPSGGFQADPRVPGLHLCIAAGSGITPVLSIAATVLSDPASRVVLIYANRTTATVMFAEELADLKDRYGPRLELFHVLSREPREVELLSGRLDAARLRSLLETLVPLPSVDHVWLCGPFGLVTEARSVLQELDVPPERVHVELFYVDEPPPAVVRGETVVEGDPSEVTFVLDGRSTTSVMSRSQTLLDGAGAVRADVPFACRGGVCGTCRARVESGEVEMHRNFALEPAEVERGFVLTCQTRPVGARVVVDYDA